MRPWENWRSVFLLSQSGKKKKKSKDSKDTPLTPPPRITFPKTQWDPPQRTPQRRHTMAGPSPRSMLDIDSPGSDISPKTPAQPSDKAKSDYFSIESQPPKKEDDTNPAGPEPLSRVTTLSSYASPSPASASGSFSAESPRTETHGGRPRGSSAASLAFAPLRNPSLPQGNQKKTGNERIRASSPPPER
ncbi:hypothetical protein LZ31DRAFT_156384 [Colletotrichum somersetense]|nr:hypothetical protein LZ31DRAFT_156384 [Colletotrichum somersetense]